MGLHNYGFMVHKNYNNSVIIAEYFPLDEWKENRIIKCLDNITKPFDEKSYQFLCETLSSIGIDKNKRRELRKFIGEQTIKYGCLD